MKLIVFGATGGTGRQLVAQALAQGHTVTAFDRNPDRLGQEHENLRLVKGSVLDLPSVENAVQGQDAVLCALGAPIRNKDKIRARGTKNIIQAMDKTSVRRLICQTAMGCGDSRQLLPFHYKYFVAPVVLRHIYADHEIQESVIKDSQLDWTIVRPVTMTHGEPTGTYWHGFTVTGKAIAFKISRADVADFMLRQLADDTYLHKTPAISYA